MTKGSVVLALLTACTQQPSMQVWKSPSGKSYRVMASGPVQGQGWKGVFVKYDAPTEDARVLRESADDLMNALIKEADKSHVDTIVVTADHAPEGRKGFVTRSRGYNDVYRRTASGGWEHIDRR